MSSSIAIPTTPATTMDYDNHRHRRQSSKMAASSSSSYSTSPIPGTPETASKGSPSSGSAQKQKMLHERRPSLLSKSPLVSAAILHFPPFPILPCLM